MSSEVALMPSSTIPMETRQGHQPTNALSVRRPRRRWYSRHRPHARRSKPASDDDHDLLAAASKAAVDAMPRVTITHDHDRLQGMMNMECPICLEELEIGCEATKMPCDCKRSLFHSLCLQTWLPKNASCPLCRFPVTLIPNPNQDH